MMGTIRLGRGWGWVGVWVAAFSLALTAGAHAETVLMGVESAPGEFVTPGVGPEAGVPAPSGVTPAAAARPAAEVLPPRPAVQPLTFGIEAGYAGTNLTAVEDALGSVGRQVAGDFYAQLGGAGGTQAYGYHVTETEGGAFAAAWAAYRITPAVQVGLRVSYLKPSDILLDAYGRGTSGVELDHQARLEISVLAPQAQVSATHRFLQGGVWVTAEAGAGPAFGRGRYTVRTDDPLTYTGPGGISDLSGIGADLTAGAALGVDLMPGFSVRLGAGYHYCTVGEMSAGDGWTFSDAAGGHPTFDLSGFDYRLGACYGF